MIKSMTAFSQQEKTTSDGTLNWEIRTVNHRNLDISLNLPEFLKAEESNLIRQIRDKLGRGKINAKLTYDPSQSESTSQIVINEDKVKALLAAAKKLQDLSSITIGFSTKELLGWPDVIVENQQTNNEQVAKEAKDLLEISLDLLIKNRETEGSRLNTLIETRCKAITAIVKTVRSRRVKVQENLRQKILKKLSEIDIDADPNRLEQELVYHAQRLDVDEELDRLDSHIEEVFDVLKRDEPIGKRLDFLIQELNREANTLASKSNDSETTKSAVELKVLIEQMREQVMNIE